MKNRFTIFVFLPTVALFIIAFWVRGVLLLDPDFGWHVQMGEIIERIGIPQTDPFSYTMSGYPFVDHEWLTNVIFAKLYPIINTEGLAIIFALLAMASLIIRLTSISKWTVVPFVLASTIFMSFVGIRTQVITWLFYSIFLVIIFNPKAWQWRIILLPLSIVWANFHGGFGIGISVLFAVITTHIWEQKRIIVRDIILFFLCVLGTLCSPYGISLWKELWMQISDSSLRWSIQEWQPAIFFPSFALWIFVPFSVFVVTRYIKKLHLTQTVVFFGLLLAGVSSVRHMPLFVLTALPMTIWAIERYSKDVKAYGGGTERLRKAYMIFAIGVVITGIVEALLIIGLTGSSYIAYPEQAIKFLVKNESCGQLFSTYSWGGYLDWKLPQKKVFIDGRMPSWRRKSPSLYESSYAFEEYNRVLGGKIPVSDIIKKYNIDTFLLPVEKKISIPLLPEGLQKMLKRLLNGQYKGYSNLTKQLTDSGLREAYKDNAAVVYRQKRFIHCTNPN